MGTNLEDFRMGYGIKVSQAGYPVDTAADNQLLFSSSFPSLILLFTGTLNAGSDFYHNLGYYPVAFAFDNITVPSTPSQSFESASGVLNIYTDHITNTASNSVRYYIYGRDLRTTMSGTNINTTPATQTSVNQDYGFKVSVEGTSVLTAGLDDLVSFSGLSVAGYGVRQHIIHQTGYEDSVGSGSTKNYSHSLGYPPMYFPFYRKQGDSFYNYAWSYTISSGSPQLSIQISSSQLTFINNSGNTYDFAYLIFKDPSN